MLKGIVIENYRSCLSTKLNLHPSLSVLIGPNSSGKTNLLQAIMLLSKLASEEPEHYVKPAPPTGAPSRIRAVFEIPSLQVQLKASLALLTDESNNDKLLGSRQKWTFKRRRKKYKSEMPLSLAIGMDPRLSPTAPAFHMSPQYYRIYRSQLSFRGFRSELPKEVARGFVEISRFCRGFRYYSASQFTNPANCPTSFQIERDEGRGTFARFRGHTKILYDMYIAQKVQQDKAYEQFLQIVGPKGLRLIDALTFGEVQASSTEYSVRVGGKVEPRKRENRLIIPQFKIGRQILSPNQLSEGTFKTLALLFHLFRKDSRALLIEEPEVCVHHGLLASILEIIKTASEEKQIVLSTHSDYVLDHVKPENVFSISFDKGSGTIARQIRETMNAKEFAALRLYLETEGNLGEYWREGGFGDRP